MQYSDSENARWWKGLSKQDQAELFERMVVRSQTEGARDFALALRSWWTSGKEFTPRQLVCVRKYERRPTP